MFGYITPCKAELKVREWTLYRSYYCGLCKELKREYGFVSRFLLNYDMVLLAMTADGLAGTQPELCAERCIAGPFHKRPVCPSTAGLRLAADALILTAYYKVEDDIADESFLKKARASLLRILLKRPHQKAAQRLPDADKLFSEQTAAQQALEKRRCTVVDEAAEPTAQMTGALFAQCGPQRDILHRMGLFLGKILYFLDAAEDYAKDVKQGAYNVFVARGCSREEAASQAQMLCRMCAGEMALCYNLLDFSVHKSILDNIVFLGLPQSIGLAGIERPRRNRHDPV